MPTPFLHIGPEPGTQNEGTVKDCISSHQKTIRIADPLQTSGRNILELNLCLVKTWLSQMGIRMYTFRQALLESINGVALDFMQKKKKMLRQLF